MKIKELLIIKDSLVNLAKILLPSSVDNYNVYKLYTKVETELQNYNTQKDKIVLEYGKKDAKGVISITIDNPYYEKAIQMLTELGDIEVDIVKYCIELDETDLKLCPYDLYTLINANLLKIREEAN